MVVVGGGGVSSGQCYCIFLLLMCCLSCGGVLVVVVVVVVVLCSEQCYCTFLQSRVLLAVWRRALQVLRQYNEYLKEQMVKEAQDEAQYDEIRQKAEGRIWDQRDAQLKAQHDAREALMQQVSPPTPPPSPCH